MPIRSLTVADWTSRYCSSQLRDAREAVLSSNWNVVYCRSDYNFCRSRCRTVSSLPPGIWLSMLPRLAERREATSTSQAILVSMGVSLIFVSGGCESCMAIHGQAVICTLYIANSSLDEKMRRTDCSRLASRHDPCFDTVNYPTEPHWVTVLEPPLWKSYKFHTQSYQPGLILRFHPC